MYKFIVGAFPPLWGAAEAKLLLSCGEPASPRFNNSLVCGFHA